MRNVACGLRVLASIVVLAVVVHSSVVRAQGTVVYGNFGPAGTGPNSTTVSFSIGVSSPNNQAYAQPFRTGADPNFLELQSITFSFGQPSGATTPNVGIYSSNSGAPDTFIAGLSGAVGDTAKDLWTPASPVQLAGSTDYFIVVADSTGTSTGFNWYLSDTEFVAGQNSSGWTQPFQPLKSLDGGTTWQATSLSERNVGFSVVAAPEPSSFVIAGIGLPALAWIAARRRKSTRGPSAAVTA